MDQRHQEYCEYYKSRMQKYENNSIYKNSYKSEKALYDAINSSADLDEFGKKVEKENLAVKNAIALVKDHETARAELLEDLKEYIKLHAPLRILETLDSVKTDIELVNKVSGIEADVNIETTLDLMTDYFYYDFQILEEIEAYENAEVPDKWKSEINKEYPQSMIDSGRETWAKEVLPRVWNWDPDWKFNFDSIWEERHRRLIPVPDESIKKRIEQFKRYRGI